MSVATPAYLEIIDFIASSNPQAVVEFSGLTAEEKSELDHFLELEHILRMAKAKARLILAR